MRSWFALPGIVLGPALVGVLGDPRTGYTRLLETVFLVHRLPAWGTSLGARVNVHPKIHLMDTGVGGWLHDQTVEAVERRSPSVLTDLGHLIETFAVNELLKQ
ncbi:MAG: DUF4143 domain-containing protein, partial [Pseudonocardia sp.]|nr:DUF4143 domain-containing protein [Pseudonocardia sp.]